MAMKWVSTKKLGGRAILTQEKYFRQEVISRGTFRGDRGLDRLVAFFSPGFSSRQIKFP